MKPEDCALVILASGESRRFGAEDKLMAELDGKPILQHVIDVAAPIGFAGRFAVIPEFSKSRRSLLSDAGFTLIENPDPSIGQGSSLQLAAKGVLANGHKSMCLMLGDMPFVSTQHILDMITQIKDKDKAISHCNNIVLPPAIFSGVALDSLVNIDPKAGAKSLFLMGDIYKHPLSKRAAEDIDTPETLATLQGVI